MAPRDPQPFEGQNDPTQPVDVPGEGGARDTSGDGSVPTEAVDAPEAAAWDVPTEAVDAPRPPEADDKTPTLEIPVQQPAPAQQYVVEGGGALYHPEQPASEPAAQPAEPAPRRKRRKWPVITAIVVVVLAGVAIGGWIFGESWARGEVVSRVQQETRAALGLNESHPVEVGVAGAVLPQVIAGSLDEIDVSADDVPFAGVTGDITAKARDIAIRGETAVGEASGRVTLSQQSAQQLLATSTGLTAVGVQLTPPDVVVSLDPGLFNSGVDVALTMRPSAGGGQLLLTPEQFSVAGGTISADAVRARFGDFAEPMLSPRAVCIASALPRALTLTDVSVDDAGLTAGFDIDGAVATDASLRDPGSC